MSIKFWLMHNRSRIITALVFCLVFTLLAFAPPFSTSAHAIALVDDAILLVFAALLSACGIYIVSDSSVSVTDFLQDAITDFCTDTGTDWDSAKSSFNLGVNKTGDILASNSVLDFFTRFSDWMTRFYGFSNNSSVTVSGSMLPYFPLQGGGAIYLSTSGPYHSMDGATPLYFGQTYTLSNGVSFVMNLAGSTLTFTVDGQQIFNSPYYSGVTFYWFFVTPFGFSVTNRPIGTQNPSYADSVQLSADLFGMTPLEPSGSVVTADTAVIDIPVAGTDYTDEDGVVIGGIGSWGDSWNDLLNKLREWLDSQTSSSVADPTITVEAESEIVSGIETDLLSTDNWPGMIPPVGFTEFSFSSIWHYVTDWLAAFSGTLATVLGISFALPAVSIVYAVIVLSLTLWLLRKVSS